jgi:3-hydroxyacyl-CoA dehydrogenase
MSRPIASVAVVGGGFMGAGIAETAATCGIPVIIRELPEYLEATRQRLESSLDPCGETGKTRRRGSRSGAVPDYLDE